MKRLLNWRIALIIAITVGSIIYLVPTFRYFVHVSSDRPSDEKGLQAWLEKSDQIREKAIPLGLDIQGGTDVVLEVDVQKTLVTTLAQRQRDLKRMLDADNVNADVALISEGRQMKIQVKDPQHRRIAANSIETRYKDILSNWNSAAFEKNGEIVVSIKPEIIQQDERTVMETALKVIRDRVNVFGLTQASVTRQGDDRIRVQIPGERDPERVIKNIIKPAVLKFYLVHEQNDQLVGELFENNGNFMEGETRAKPKSGAAIPSGYKALPGKYELREEERLQDPDKVPVGRMYIVRETEEMGGANLENAWVNFNPSDFQNPIVVSLEFDKDGARQFHAVTREYAEKTGRSGRQLAIALDEYVYSAPVLRVEIADGRAQIEGNFDQQEAKDLSLVLKAGALPAELKTGQARTVEATLGADSIAKSLQALVYGALIVAAFMIVYYGTAGIIAVFALILNVLILMAIMRMSHATLTLSGIGGILLTIGMAVDANVLIYERMREELRSGKPMRQALAAGFNRAFSVILDSNLTTLLTALFLLQFGEGSVQGFALTMTFGLIANLYTGLAVTYALCEAWFRMRGTLNLGKMQLLKNPNIPFIQSRYVTFGFSAFLTVVTIIALMPREAKPNFGPGFAVDFTGGIMAEVALDKNYGAGEIDQRLAQAGLEGTSTQKFGDVEGGRDALIRVPLAEGEDIEPRKAELTAALEKAFGAGKYNIRGTSEMTAEIGQEFWQMALLIIGLGSLAVLLYLWFRYELTFAAGAVVAILHDMFLTLGMITLLKIDISLDVISAFLILLGYSVNDTIVIYDRIREQVGEHSHDKDLLHICNDSMNQTLGRTMITGVATLLVMVLMFFFGGHSLKPFALTLFFGIVFGTYSSVFVAAPIVYEWAIRRRGGKLALTKKASQTTTRSRAQRRNEITA